MDQEYRGKTTSDLEYVDLKLKELQMPLIKIMSGRSKLMSVLFKQNTITLSFNDPLQWIQSNVIFYNSFQLWRKTGQSPVVWRGFGRIFTFGKDKFITRLNMRPKSYWYLLKKRNKKSFKNRKLHTFSKKKILTFTLVHQREKTLSFLLGFNVWILKLITYQ